MAKKEHWSKRIKRENAELKAENTELKAKLDSRGSENAPTGWNPQVDKKRATKHGLTADDFRFEHYTLSDLELVLPEAIEGAYYPAEIVLAYRCDIPKETPQCNQYNLIDGNYIAIPDPKGICLEAIETQVIIAETGAVVDEDGRGHIDGKVVGSFTDKLFEKLNLTDAGDTVKVRLTSKPRFFWLNDEGGADMTYCNNSNGSFNGEQIESPIYTLSMDADGKLVIKVEV